MVTWRGPIPANRESPLWLDIARGVAALAGMWVVGMALITVAVGGTLLWWERVVLPLVHWLAA